jgi:hypothetical protein
MHRQARHVSHVALAEAASSNERLHRFITPQLGALVLDGLQHDLCRRTYDVGVPVMIFIGSLVSFDLMPVE